MRRFVRILARLAAVIVIGLGGAYLFLRTPPGREVLRERVEEAVRRSVPGLEIGGVRGDLLSEVELSEVVIRDDQGRPVLSVPELRATYDLSELLGGAIHLESLEVSGPHLAVRPGFDPGALLSRAGPRRPDADPARSIRIERLSIRDGSAAIERPGGAIAVTNLDVEGSIDGRGRRWEVDLESLGAEVRSGDLTAQVTAALEGRFEDGHLDGRIERLEVRGLASAPLRLAGTARGPLERLAFDLTLRGPHRARLELAGWVALRGDGKGEYAVEIDGRHWDPRLLRPSWPAGDVALGGRLTGRGVPGAPGARWRLAPLSVTARGATVVARGHGHDRVFDVGVSARLAGPLGIEGLRGKGNVSLELTGELAGELHAAATARLRHFRVGALRSESVALEADLAGLVRAGWLERLQGRARLDARHLAARGVSLRRLTLSAQGRRDALAVRARVESRNASAELAARVRLRREEARIDLASARASFLLDGVRETLVATAPARILIERGRAARVEDLRLRASGARLAGEARLDARYSLDPRAARRAELRLGVRADTIDGLDQVTADVVARLGRRRAEVTLSGRVAGATVELAAGVPVRLPARHVAPRVARSGELDVRLRAERLALARIPGVAPLFTRVGLDPGSLEGSAQLVGPVAAPTSRIALEAQGFRWRSGAPGRPIGASIGLEADGQTVRGRGTVFLDGRPVALARAGAPVSVADLLARGRLGPAVPFAATMDLVGIDAGLIPWTQRAGVAGTLVGRASASGTLETPSILAELALENPTVRGIPLSAVSALGVVRDGAAHVRGRVDHAGGTAAGMARVSLAGTRTIDASVVTRGFELAVLSALAPQLRELGGRLDATLLARGPLAAPRWSGAARLREGRVGLPGQPTFERIELDAALSPGELRIERFRASSGGGSATAHGHVTLDGLRPLGVQLEVDADDFLIAVRSASGARLQGKLRVEAATRDAVLTGQVEVPSALVELPRLSGGRKLHPIGIPDDVVFAGRADGAEREPAVRELDLRGRARSVRVRSRDLLMDLEARLRLIRASDGELRLIGTVRAQRGRLRFSRQEFLLERGFLRFSGDGVEPTLEVRLTHQYPEALVAVELRGPMDDPEIRLSSDPPVYSQGQIVALVLTGRPGGPTPEGGAFDPTTTLASVVLARLADALAPQLGLDVLRVERIRDPRDENAGDPELDTRVEIGKYLGERVYFSYAHVFGAPEERSANEAHIEYFVTRRWILETVIGDAGAGSIDAMWTHRY